MPLKAAMPVYKTIILESSLSGMIVLYTVHRQSPVDLLVIDVLQNAATQAFHYFIL